MLDVLLICPSVHRSAISNHINNDSTSSLYASLRIDLQGLEETPEQEQGTTAILTHFAGRIKTDFILLPCDFIPPPSLPLVRLLNKFRTDVSAELGIAVSCWFETSNEKPSFEEEDGSIGAVPIVWDSASSTLLHITSKDEREDGGDELSLRSSLLSRCVYPAGKLMIDASLTVLQVPARVDVCKVSGLACICVSAICLGHPGAEVSA
jgi:translation initiation factor eIF-2B subunit gamma